MSIACSVVYNEFTCICDEYWHFWLSFSLFRLQTGQVRRLAFEWNFADRTLPSNLPAFPYCGWTSCSPSRVPQRSETEALFLHLGSMHLVLNKNTKPSSPHACILFLDITNGGWGLSGCDLLCNRWSFNVLWVTEWDGGFCAAAHACAVMMNECLVCCVYGAVM